MTGKFSGFTVPPGQFGEIVGRPAIPGPAAVGLRPGLGLLQDMERANKLNELPHWSSMPKYVAPPRQ